MLRRSRTSVLRTILVLSVLAICLLGLASAAFAVDADTFESNNSSATATVLNIGDPQDHTIHIEGDEDWFVLTATAGVAYVFETTAGDGMDTEMRLYDSSINEVAYSDDEGDGAYSKITYTAEYSGSYFVKVTGYGGFTTGSYVMNMAFAPTGSISGRVTNAATDGLPDIEVQLYEYFAMEDYWDWTNTFYTDVDGYYTVEGLETGTYRLWFLDNTGTYLEEGYDNALDIDSATDISVTDGSDTPGKNVTLAQAGHITGTVTNISNAKLDGIYVESSLYFEGYGWDAVSGAYTGLDGTYDIGNLGTGMYRVGFYDESGTYLGEYYNNAADVDSATDVSVTEGATTSGKNAVLANAGHITGTVTNGSGAPLQDVGVTAFQYYAEYDSWDWIGDAWTDTDGLYNVGGLFTGTYRIGFYDESGEYLSEYYNNAADVESATDIAVTAGSTTSGKSAVLADASHIVGTVTGVGGTKLSDIEVVAYQITEYGDWDWMSSSSTDMDGAYDIGGLRAGAYRVGFADYSGTYAPEYYNNATSIGAATNVNVAAGGTTTINAAMLLGGHITGTVTGSGSPLEGISVGVYQDTPQYGWDYRGEAYTDADGAYDIGGLATGTYRIGFYDESGQYLEEYYNNATSIDSATDVSVTAGATTSGKNATLALGGHITGAVTNSAYDPLTTVMVTAYRYSADWGWDWAGSAYTDNPGGTYDIGGLATGTYRVEFVDDGDMYATESYNNALDLDAGTDIAVTAGSTTSGKNAVLEIAGLIEATAENADGDPLEDISVILWGQSGTAWREVSSGYTDFGGTRVFSRLRAGNYKLQFVDPTYTFESIWYSDADNMADADVVSITVGGEAAVTQVLSDAAPEVIIAGDDRYETAVLASQQSYTDGSAETVVIASGTNWPDALGGGALAGALDGPVLLVQPTALPSVVADEIARLGASKAIVVGGISAVSDVTKNAVDALPGMSTERIGGATRYETAKMLAVRTKTELGSRYDGTVFLSTGANYPDALAASPLAAGNGWPILLTPTAALPDATRQALTGLDASRLLVIGGTSVVSDAAKAQAEAIVGAPAIRLAGANRFDTAVKIATYGVDRGGLGWNGLAFATGRKFPDALAGGCAQGKKGSVLLLTEVTTLPAETRAALEDHKSEINQVWFFGGDAAINGAVRTQVANILQ